MIGGSEKGVLKWKGAAEVLFTQATRMLITFFGQPVLLSIMN
jgi:hypothetical protein